MQPFLPRPVIDPRRLDLTPLARICSVPGGFVTGFKGCQDRNHSRKRRYSVSHGFFRNSLEKIGAAVELYGLAGHVGIADHHQHRLRHLLWVTHAAKRDARHDLVAAAACHVGLDQ